MKSKRGRTGWVSGSSLYLKSLLQFSHQSGTCPGLKRVSVFSRRWVATDLEPIPSTSISLWGRKMLRDSNCLYDTGFVRRLITSPAFRHRTTMKYLMTCVALAMLLSACMSGGSDRVPEIPRVEFLEGQLIAFNGTTLGQHNNS